MDDYHNNTIVKDRLLYDRSEDGAKEYSFYEKNTKIGITNYAYHDPIIMGKLSIISYTRNTIITSDNRKIVCMVKQMDREEVLLNKEWIRIPLDIFYSSAYDKSNQIANKLLQEVLLMLSIRENQNKNIWFEAKDPILQDKVESSIHAGIYSFTKRIIKLQ